MNVIAARTAIAAMAHGISAALRATPRDPAAAVAQVLGHYAADPTLLSGQHCPCRADTYIRHLLHEDAEQGWAVAALVWRPGQMSPVHGHRVWCAVAVHQGIMTESFYVPDVADGPPRQTGVALRRPGDITHGPACPDAIHRLANLGTETAVSIHAYGLPYARFCSNLNTVHAA